MSKRKLTAEEAVEDILRFVENGSDDVENNDDYIDELYGDNANQPVVENDDESASNDSDADDQDDSDSDNYSLENAW